MVNAEINEFLASCCRICGEWYPLYCMGTEIQRLFATTRTAPNMGIESERSWYVTPDGTLMVNVRRNSFFSVTRSIGEDMYPRGTTVDIYYDPKKPKRAFVIAYFRRTWVPVLVGAVCVSTYLVMALSLALIWMMG